MKLEFNDELYYNCNDMYSHDCMINFVFGGRGLGKSFAFKRKAINNFLRKGEQTIYLRRTQTELDLVKKTYFNDIKDYYEGVDFYVNGNEGFINGELAIVFVALSTSSNFKSSSYPKASLILFDEYLIPQNGGGAKRYLKNEAFLLLELYETIFRLREGKLVLLANSISLVNPLFTYFDIEIKDSKKRFHKFKNNLILVELCRNELYERTKSQTKFGQLIDGTEYGDYAISNVAYEDNDAFISKRPTGSLMFLCSITYMDKELGFWLGDYNSVYVDYYIHEDSNFRLVIFNEDLRPNKRHIKEFRQDYKSWYVRNAFHNSLMYYYNQEIKKLVSEISLYF